MQLVQIPQQRVKYMWYSIGNSFKIEIDERVLNIDIQICNIYIYIYIYIYKFLAFKNSLQFLQSNCVNAVTLSLN